MTRKSAKIDVSSPRSSLTDSPFGVLAGLKGDLPEAPAPAPAPQAEILPEAATDFGVGRTRKGGWPIAIEKRASGKVVTVIRNVSGDGNGLLKTLRKHCATGGVEKDGTIELQGDHRQKVAAWFDTHLP